MNIVNNRFVTVPDTTAQTGAGSLDSAKTGDTRPAESTAAAAADNLMSQLMDDTAATNLRPNSAIIEQALKEASLPVNESNTAVVTALLEGNMPIGRDSIRMTLAQLKAYPELPPEALINMNKAGIAVNAESAATMRDFLNNVAILTENLSDLADMLENVLSDPSTSPEFVQTIQNAIYETINAAPAVTPEVAAAVQTAIANETPAPELPETTTLSREAVAQTSASSLQTEAQTQSGDDASGTLISDNLDGSEAKAGGTLSSQPGLTEQTAVTPATGEDTAQSLPEQTTVVSASDGQTSTVLPEQSAANSQTHQAGTTASPATPADIPITASNEDLSGHNDYSFRSFEELTGGTPFTETQAAQTTGIDVNAQTSSPTVLEAAQNSNTAELPRNIRNLSAREFKDMLKNALSLSPDKLSKSGIRDLYERSQDFISKIRDAASHDEVHAKIFAKASQAMQNLDMLNNLNHIYPHIELPLKLQNEKADGGLYVYTNRKSHVSSDAVTALLHLNLPHLGLVDIHLSLKDRYLGMNFYTNDEAGSLLENDITSLREKLESMDYSVFTRFNPQENEAKDLRDIMSSSGSGLSSSGKPERLSFDIRA